MLIAGTLTYETGTKEKPEAQMLQGVSSPSPDHFASCPSLSSPLKKLYAVSQPVMHAVNAK
jgi:hypothetical protein